MERIVEEDLQEDVEEKKDDIVEIEEEETSSEEEVSEELTEEKTKSEQLDFPEGFLKKIEGKGENDLKKMLYESEKFRGTLTNELGELRAEKRDTPKTSKNIKEEISKTEQKIKEFQNRIDKLDEDIDEDDIRELQSKQEKLRSRKKDYEQSYTETFINEAVQNIAVGDANNKIAQEQRDKYKSEYGLEFSDEDWNGITEYAKSVSKEPKLSQEDYEYSLMKAYGLDKYNKLKATIHETQTRNKIQEASKKQVVNVGKTAKKSTISIDFNTSPEELDAQLDKLSIPQLKRLRSKINK